MTHAPFLACALTIALLVLPTSASAQWVVYDPSNHAQALLRYYQLIQQYQHLLRQARRLPAAMAGRYQVPEVKWRTHDFQYGFPYARPILTGLNYGDAAGDLYFRAVDRLEPLDAALSRVPAAFRRRLGNDYGTIEMADSIATMGIHQAGAIRFNGRSVLRALQAMEDDLIASPEDFHTQTALLNKINGATVLGLRINETTSQFMMHTLEQLLVENKRKRDSEAKLMNAHIHQWLYGERYGQALFRNPADRVDTWRQP